MYKRFTSVHFESLITVDCNNKGKCRHLAKVEYTSETIFYIV